MGPRERIARALCRLLDDEWRLGKDLYMRTAAEIITDIGYDDMLEALTEIAGVFQVIIEGEGFDPSHCDSPVLNRALAAIEKAAGHSSLPTPSEQ